MEHPIPGYSGRAVPVMPAAADSDVVREYAWKGRAGPFTLHIPPDVFMPSSTSRVLADALEINPGETVADLGCGSGVLSFVAARLGAGRVVGCDFSAAAVACATDNAARLGLADVSEFRVGNLAEPVSDVRPDVVIADVSGIPDEIARATGWFPGGLGGGPTGSELPIAMLEQIGELLGGGGRVYLPTGTIQAQDRVLAAARRIFGEASMEQVAQREFPLPQAVAAEPGVAQLIGDGVVALGQRGSRFTWRLTVWCCRSA